MPMVSPLLKISAEDSPSLPLCLVVQNRNTGKGQHQDISLIHSTHTATFKISVVDPFPDWTASNCRERKDPDPHQREKLDPGPEQSDKLDPDPHQFADGNPYENWAYMSNFQGFLAFIWKLGSGSASKWKVPVISGSKWQAGSGSASKWCWSATLFKSWLHIRIQMFEFHPSFKKVQ